DSVSLKPLSGTDGALLPFWSPDSRSIAFFADRQLKRIDLDGGSVRMLANATVPTGGAWNRDGRIFFVAGSAANIAEVSATGGPVKTALSVRLPRLPQFLPDGNHLMYYLGGGAETHGVYVSRLDGSEARRLLD